MPDAEYRRLARLRRNLERRALIYHFARAFFQEQGFLEVETPVRMPEIAPEQYIVPYDSEGWFLSTSPELHMKRLLAAGYDRIFQMSRCFRKGERGRWHNSEFTLLEWYRAGGDYRQMIHDTEKLIVTLAERLGFGRRICYQKQEIDLTPPWPRVTVREAFLSAAGWDPVAALSPSREAVSSRGGAADVAISPELERFDIDLVTRVIPGFSLDRPTVLLDYPASMASLARLKPGDPLVAERAEVFIGGLELANAFSELCDLEEQRKRFRQESRQIRREQGRKSAMPRRFLKALPRLPQCGGIAVGMDRLVMLLCDAASIDEVMPFTADRA